MQILGLVHDELDVEAELLRRIANPDRVRAGQARLLLELVRHLRTQGPIPQAFGFMSGDELWLSPVRQVNPIIVKVWADWQDYGPSRAGVPMMHYRLQFRNGKASILTDARVNTPGDAERIVWDAFGWNR